MMEPVERVSDAEAGSLVRNVARALEKVRERIERACAQAGKDATGIRILAVTKGFGPEAIEAAIAANIADIGENYFQEAQAKFARVHWPTAPDNGATVRRHFIGPVQRNKARKIAGLFDVVQTVDDMPIASALDRGAQESGKVLDVLIQVNVSSDDRAGVPVEESAQLAREIAGLPALRLRGVMAVGPLEPAGARAAFDKAAQAYRTLAAEHAHIDTLSMGMSGDLEVAVAAGATMVRIGTGLFGARPVKGEG
jgi:pyridoxal phosphate enzyme (YggS family)